VFEQSILLNDAPNRPRNLLVSLSAELMVISVVVLIPLVYSDHLPIFEWKDIAIRSTPAPLRAKLAPFKPGASTNSPMVSAPRPLFRYVPTVGLPPAASDSSFVADAPPSLSGSSAGPGPGMLGTVVIVPATLPPPPKPAPHASTPSKPIAVGGSVQMAKLIRMVKPQYPAIAITARISGVVHLLGIIAKDGTIRNLQLVGGQPLLAQAAMQAVAQWVYQPTLLNGQPVEVIAPIEVTFTLGH
jgi:protein TonB